MMRIARLPQGTLKVFGSSYILSLPSDRPFVYIDSPFGERILELFLYSSVHALHDRDDSPERSSWVVDEGEEEVCLTTSVRSSLWSKKTYRLRCLPQRLVYEIEVEGRGQLWEVDYFGGYYSGQTRWGSGFFGSGQRLTRGFNPEPNSDEAPYFSPAESASIDLFGVPLPGRSDWFFTPSPFCFPFQHKHGWLGFGIQAQAGEYRFTSYGYHGRRGGFYLSLAYDGQTQVAGTLQLPAVGIDFAGDEYGVLAAHVQALQTVGGAAEPRSMVKPRWWYEPIFCGWGAQNYAASLERGKGPDYARQEQYDRFLAVLDARGVNPGIVVLDDKWQAAYGDNQVDLQKWPDLPGFIRRQHDQGRKVLLWLKAWDPEGLPVEECITNRSGLALAFDPTNPAFEERLRASVRQMLAPEGCDADGFKIDFTARIPGGPGLCLYGDLWGLELLKRYLAILYNEAKRVKPEALIMTHTPHPYLADVLDMVRLNDINTGHEVNQAMERRARIAALACPQALIDTDNWPMKNRAAWRRYARYQPELGVPSLYFASHIDSSREPLTEADYALLRETWQRHRERIAGQSGTPSSGMLTTRAPLLPLGQALARISTWAQWRIEQLLGMGRARPGNPGAAGG
jgi:hypothetical protein